MNTPGLTTTRKEGPPSRPAGERASQKPVPRPLPAAVRRWPLVLALAAAGTAAAALASSAQPRLFRAHATLLVAPDGAALTRTDSLRALEALDRRSLMASLARMPEGDAIRSQAAARAGLSGPAVEQYRVSGLVVPNTMVLRVEVEGPEAAATARAAQAFADVTRDEVARIYPLYAPQSLEAGRVPPRPSQPLLPRNLLLGALAGTVAGVALALTGREFPRAA